MNALKKIDHVKKIVNDMGGKFISFINENEILVKNQKDKAVWQFPIVEGETGYIFNGSKATKLSGTKIKKDAVKSHSLRLQKNIKNLFSSENYDEAIIQLKRTIKTLPYVEQDDKINICSSCKTIMGTDPDNPGEFLCPNKKCETNTELMNQASQGKPEGTKNTANSVVTEAMNKMIELFKDFSKTSFLFDEEGNANKIDNLKSYTGSDKQALIAESRMFLKNIKDYKNFKNELSKKISTEVADTFFEAFAWTDDEFGPATARALTRTKQKHSDLNIVETLKLIKASVIEFYNEEPDVNKAAPWVYNLITPNDKERPGFLQFRTGAFNFENLKTMSEEISRAIASYKDLTPEQLDKLGNYRVIVEYMIHTKQINDHVLTTMVEEFNELFKKTDDDYDHNILGFRNRDEQFKDWIKGYARGIDLNLSDNTISTEG